MSEEEKNEIEEVEVDLPETELADTDTDTGETVEPEFKQEAQAEPEQSEEELENYSKNVQKRIKKLTEKYRKEERDREEAVRLAQTLREENEKLKTQVQGSQQAHLTEYGARLDNQLNLAKQAYRDAHDRGDLDKQFEAQQMMNQIAIEQERYRLAKQQQERVQVQKAPEEQAAPVQQPVQQERAPEPDPRAQDWASKNEWFGQDEVMTYAAFGIHRKLVEEEGFDPTSDEYYNEIDRQIRTEFPHKFAGQKNGRSGQVASADTSASRKPQSGRRKVKLSPSQVAIAKKLGVPLEEYAKYVKD
jgi:hypothetical protein